MAQSAPNALRPALTECLFAPASARIAHTPALFGFWSIRKSAYATAKSATIATKSSNDDGFPANAGTF
jgi:hypothetical protein